MLNTRNALELYTKLEKFVPDYEGDSLEFAGTIIDNIAQSDTPESFAESLLVMYPNKIAEEIVNMSGEEIAVLFMEGLVENKFLALVEFCKVIGYGRRS